jgi:hypothetical protein
LGAQQTFDTFTVDADAPLVANPNLEFVVHFLSKTFVTSAALPAIAGQPIMVRTASSDAGSVSALEVTPFVCAADPNFAENVQTGWSATETQQIYLQPDGVLTPENEFERQLTHHCDWLAPGGGGGEGSSTVDRSLGLCTESDRTGTMLKILDVTDPSSPRSVATTTCRAYHANRTYPPDFAGVIQDQIGIDVGDGLERVVALSHCWSTTESFPSTVTAGGTGDLCPAETMTVVTTESQTEVLASSGSWTLANGPELAGGGHQIADLDLTFGVPGGGAPAYAVQGHIDLPIVKVNVQGTNPSDPPRP